MDHHLDARGWLCPLPVMKASERIAQLSSGERLTITATDPSTVRDVQDWVQGDPGLLLEAQEEEREAGGRRLFIHRIRRR